MHRAGEGRVGCAKVSILKKTKNKSNKCTTIVRNMGRIYFKNDFYLLIQWFTENCVAEEKKENQPHVKS